MQITLLKRNIRTIQFLTSYMSNNDLYIYFDDSDGLEFFGYKIKN